MIEQQLTPQLWEASVRPTQLTEGLKAIKLATDVAAQFGGRYYFDQTRDGKKQPIEVDGQVIQAMKGGVLGIYREMAAAGNKDAADFLIGVFFSNPEPK